MPSPRQKGDRFCPAVKGTQEYPAAKGEKMTPKPGGWTAESPGGPDPPDKKSGRRQWRSGSTAMRATRPMRRRSVSGWERGKSRWCGSSTDGSVRITNISRLRVMTARRTFCAAISRRIHGASPCSTGPGEEREGWRMQSEECRMQCVQVGLSSPGPT